MEFYEKRLEEIYEQFGTHKEHGLTPSTVEEHQQQYGRNELQREETDGWTRILTRQFTGLLIYILVAAALISGLLGEWVDTIAIVAILLINGVLGFIQEYKAQSSIESLRKMASAKATVIREGEPRKVPSEELVPGDILLLETGDRIPADARLISATTLETQEGALTGESTPVHKHAELLEGDVQLGDQTNMVFSGTVVTKGRGRAVVVATGMKTEIGKIAHLIQDTDVEETPLQKDLDTLGGKLGKITLGICAVVFLVLALQGGEWALRELLEPFETAIALAVAAIPEGLPIVVTIALSFGVQRMAKKNSLVKRLPSVEALGSTTTICSDKTGTLTKNEMTVTRIWHAGQDITVDGTGYSPKGAVHGKLPRVHYEISALCNDAQLTAEDEQWRVIGDPTEGCLLTLTRKAGYDEKKLRARHTRLGEVPFSSERKRMTTINDFSGHALALTKGAPDVILEHCTKILDEDGIRPITDEDKNAVLKANREYATQALRVLGYAFKETSERDEYDESVEEDLIFVSLVGMIDPAREEAKDAVKTCKQAGVRVVMITGDHVETAKAIAKELGIEGRAVTGEELDEVDLEAEVDEIAVYARVDPEDKMHIVDALKKRGEVVAMTGDGVNDAPALKKSDIGIAMGITGTDVAKESSSMILTDDNFASIVDAVEEGRNIYTNIKKFVNYLLSSNFAEILVVLGSALLFTTPNGEPAVALSVLMLLFINILTDSLPALALGVDPGDPRVMQRPPRDPKEHIVTDNMMSNIVLIGLLVAAATLAVFGYALPGGLAYAQTVALSTLVVLEIVRLAMIRKQYNTPFFSNKWLLLAIGAVLALQAAVVYVPWLQAVFETVPLALTDWILIAGLAAATYIVGMVLGALVRKLTGQHD